MRIGPVGASVPDLKTLLLICAVLLWACVQYGLMAWALRDLMRRPRVRGDNKILWGMLILTVPVIGALLRGRRARDADRPYTAADRPATAPGGP